MASTSLSRTLSSGSATTTFTYSTWLKFSGGAGRFFTSTGTGDTYFRINSGGDIEISGHNSAATSMGYFVTSRLFRDYSAWYHLVISVDTTQATSTDRVKIYVNGVQETSFSSSTYPNQNATDNINLSGNTHYVGSTGASQYYNGLMAHVHLINGTAYDASAFGETDATTGIWKPKVSPSVTYGTNGFFLKFNEGALGTDSSPNGNNFTVNGSLTPAKDTPDNVFATLNPLDISTLAGTSNTFSNGNLSVTDGASSYIVAQSTLATSKGKWYWEVKIDATTSHIASGVGIVDFDNFTRADGGANTAYGWIYTSDGSKRNNSTSSSYGDSYATNDIIGIALDMDNGYLYFSKNGTWQNSGDPTSGASGTGSAYGSISGTIGAHAYDGSSGDAHEFSFNFGNGYFGTTAVSSAGSNGNGAIFEYNVPTGYYALNTKNINTYG